MAGDGVSRVFCTYPDGAACRGADHGLGARWSEQAS